MRLFEAREIAGGASGRNGGFALRGGAAPYPVLVDSLGRDRAAALWRWTEAELDELATLAGDAFRRTGSLRLAADDEEQDGAREEHDALARRRFRSRVEAVRRTGRAAANEISGGDLPPADGVLQPARLVRRLAARAAEAGVEIHEHTRVESSEQTGADTVVVATDGYPSGLLGELEGLIVPTRGQVIATEPVSERLFEIPHYGRHGFDYWHQTPDGRVVAGGFRDVSLELEFTAEEETTPSSRRRSRSSCPRCSAGRSASTTAGRGSSGWSSTSCRWSGPVPGADGLWVAGGYSGHGNVLGFACGRLVARAILGDRDPLLDLFEPGRLLVGDT